MCSFLGDPIPPALTTHHATGFQGTMLVTVATSCYSILLGLNTAPRHLDVTWDSWNFGILHGDDRGEGVLKVGAWTLGHLDICPFLQLISPQAGEWLVSRDVSLVPPAASNA